MTRKTGVGGLGGTELELFCNLVNNHGDVISGQGNRCLAAIVNPSTASAGPSIINPSTVFVGPSIVDPSTVFVGPSVAVCCRCSCISSLSLRT